MTSFTTLSAIILLYVGQVHAVRYRCDYYGRCYRTGIRGGAIAGIIIAAVVAMLLVCCALMRRRRAMRFRTSAVNGQLGRQIGPLYFPAPAERGAHTTPHMAETGNGFGHQHTTGTNGAAPMSMPTPQTGPAHSGIQSPPPAYKNGQGPYQAPSGAPPNTGAGGPTYAPPAGPPPS